jgi:hypothetical protein
MILTHTSNTNLCRAGLKTDLLDVLDGEVFTFGFNVGPSYNQWRREGNALLYHKNHILHGYDNTVYDPRYFLRTASCPVTVIE